MIKINHINKCAFDEFLHVISNISHVNNLSDFQVFLKKAASQLTKSDATSVVLRQGENCVYVDEESKQPLWKGMSFPLSACISGWSMLNAQTVAIENIFKDARVPASLYQDKNIQSLLVAPIINGNVIGAISAYWAKKHKPSQTEIIQLEALASISSLVFESMQFRSELEDIIHQRTEELKIANQHLAELAIQDELTGLYNRRGFFLMAEQAIKVSDRSNMLCALMFADIDGLKPVNDTYGHHAGDELIKAVATLLKNHFRKSDIVARMGGDEFCMLVINSDKNLESVNCRLQAEINAFNATRKFPYHIAISIGSILSDLTPELDIEQAISQADKLMYIDKFNKKHAKE